MPTKLKSELPDLSKDDKDGKRPVFERPVLIFDGVCNLCNSSVDWVMRKDSDHRFLFTANQHDAGQQILKAFGKNPEDVSTVFLAYRGKLYERSSAALWVARLIGFPWNLGWAFMIVPKFLRDWIYKGIANNRYRWFGKKETCRLATPEEKERFL